MPCYDQSCTSADLVNIPQLVLSDTFNTWFDRTNQIIGVVNGINIFDIGVGPTDGGLRLERGCSGSYYNGIAVLYVNPGAGIGVGSETFTNNYNKVIVDVSRLQDYGGGTGVNPIGTDYFILSDTRDTRQGSDGTPKRILARRLLPDEIEFGENGDGTLTIAGNLTVLGSVNIQGEQTYIDANDLRIEDKIIELAYSRYAEMTVLDNGSGTLNANSFSAGMTAFYDDTDIPLDTSSSTTIGTVLNWQIGTPGVSGTIRISSFTEGGVDDFVVGGNLVVTGGNYTGVLEVAAPIGIGTAFLSDELLQPAGILIRGSESDKSFLWVCNAADGGGENWNAFVANKNLGVSGPANWILSSKFASYGYDDPDVNNTFTYLGKFDSYSKYSVGPTLVMEHNPTGDPLTGATFGIVHMGSTGPHVFDGIPVYDWVQYFNADQLDGAHASTSGAPNTIPILGADGRLDPSIVNSDSIRRRFTVPGNTFSTGDVVRINSAGTLAFASANTAPQAEALGVVATVSGDDVVVVTKGFIDNLSGGTRLDAVLPLVTGNVYYLSSLVPGGLIANPDTASGLAPGEVRKAMLVAMGGNSGYVVNYTGVVLGDPTDTVSMSTFAPVGAIQPFAGQADQIPMNWLLCDGRALDVNQYSELYAVVGQAYYAQSIRGAINNQLFVEGDLRGLNIGDLIALQWVSQSGLQQAVGTINFVGAPNELVVSISSGNAADFNSLPANTQVRIYGTSESLFFLPDFRRRSPFGASFGSGIAGSGTILPAISLGQMGGSDKISLNTGVQTSDRSSARGSSAELVDSLPPYTTVNWIIRTRKGTDATIISGHDHDLRYIRYDGVHNVANGAANNLNAANRNQFRSNARVLGNGLDGSDTFRNDLDILGNFVVSGQTTLTALNAGSIDAAGSVYVGNNNGSTIFNVRGGTGAIAAIKAPLNYGVTGTTSQWVNDYNPLYRPIRRHTYADMDHQNLVGNPSTFVAFDDWLTSRGRSAVTTSVVPLTIDSVSGELSCTPMYRVANTMPTFGQRTRLPQGFIWIVRTEGDVNNKAYIKVSDGSPTGVMIPITTSPDAPPTPPPVPVGGIIMWSGAISSIPSGWALCNGQNGTPDLRDKFIVGAATDSGGAARTTITGTGTKTGGQAQVTLSNDQMPTHTHYGRYSFKGSDDYHESWGHGAVVGYAGNQDNVFTVSNQQEWEARASTPNDQPYPLMATGGGQAHENLPPYYSLAFIMKLA